MTTRSIIELVAFIGALFWSAASSHARPNYKKTFDSQYSQSNKTTCTICHGGDGKKKLNHYGTALKKELREPKVTDDEKIKQALKAIESGKCQTGKWKERLEKGKAPCEDKPDEHVAESYITRQLQRDASLEQLID